MIPHPLFEEVVPDHFHLFRTHQGFLTVKSPDPTDFARPPILPAPTPVRTLNILLLENKKIGKQPSSNDGSVASLSRVYTTPPNWKPFTAFTFRSTSLHPFQYRLSASRNFAGSTPSREETEPATASTAFPKSSTVANEADGMWAELPP